MDGPVVRMACGGCAAARDLTGDGDEDVTRQLAVFLRDHDACATGLRLTPVRVPAQRSAPPGA